MDHLDPLLSSADAARILDVTPASVRLMQKRGELTVAEITTGGIHLYRQSEVSRLATERAKRSPLPARRNGGRR
jgi:hypothetical protein